MKSTFKSILYILGALIIFGLAKQIGKDTAKASIKAIKGDDNVKGEVLNSLIKEINEKIQLPLIIDKETTLVKVYAIGEDNLVYEYLITAESVDVVAFKPIIFERIKDNIGKKAKQIGISITYIYKSKNSDKIIGVIKFDKNDF